MWQFFAYFKAFFSSQISVIKMPQQQINSILILRRAFVRRNNRSLWVALAEPMFFHFSQDLETSVYLKIIAPSQLKLPP